MSRTTIQGIDFACFRCSYMKTPLDKCIYYESREPDFCEGFHIEEKPASEGYDDYYITQDKILKRRVTE